MAEDAVIFDGVVLELNSDLVVANKWQMKGNCKLVASLESLDKEVLEKKDSSEFKVTDELLIDLEISEDVVMPGDVININGKISGSYDDFGELSGVLAFDGKEQKFR